MFNLFKRGAETTAKVDKKKEKQEDKRPEKSAGQRTETHKIVSPGIIKEQELVPRLVDQKIIRSACWCPVIVPSHGS